MNSSKTTEKKPPVAMVAKKQAPRQGWMRRLVGDILYVAKRDRKWWLIPLIFLLLLLAGLLAFVVSLGPLAPFIYPLL